MKRLTLLSILRATLIIATLTSFIFTSCNEDVDSSSLFISHQQTMADYIKEKPEFSDFSFILSKVKLSNKDNASTLSAVLSSRGNYLCFIPKNEAIKTFLDSINQVQDFDIKEISDSDAINIAKSCIIDYAENITASTIDFPETGALGNNNLNERAITVTFDTINGDYIINSYSRIIQKDIKVSNGLLEVVDRVISPTTNTLPTLINKTPNMRIMGRLLKETGWDKSMQKYRDLDYEEKDHPQKIVSHGFTCSVPQHRFYGYTGFVETDNVLHEKWNIPLPVINENDEIDNWEDIVEKLNKQCAIFYTNTSDNLKEEDNAINKFVSYHFIKGAYSYTKLVRHFNEFNYNNADTKNPQTKNLSINVWNYFETFGKDKRLIKVMQVANSPEHDMRINRYSYYNNGPKDDFSEILPAIIKGVLIKEQNANYDNNALNGFVYAINDVLIYNEDVKNKVLNERLRLHACNLFPEMITNNIRFKEYHYLPYGYLEGLKNVTKETDVLYLNQFNGYWNWNVMDGDCWHFMGIFDFTFKLPPVPKTGTYQLRMGLSTNSARGMAQIYLGENPEALHATGLPIDMRQGTHNNPNIPWEKDETDETQNRENDKNLRNHGYLKGPKGFCVSNGTSTTPVRTLGDSQISNLRLIITTQMMEAGKDYYLRFKSALEKTDAQFCVDYFELVPKNIYGNESKPEDIW